MNVKVLSAGILGIDSYPVEVEVEVSLGMKKFEMVGLAEGAVKEGRTRIDAAIRSSGYAGGKWHIRVNLSPASVKKQGALYDLPIAVGILSSRGVITNFEQDRFIMMGELSFDGRVKSVKKTLLAATLAAGMNKKMIVPKMNLKEVSAVKNLEAYGVDSLDEAVRFLNGEIVLEKSKTPDDERVSTNGLDFSDVKGQEAVKRAVSIAVAGGHNLLMIGPPGSGKSMIAKRIPTILPAMTYDEQLDTTRVYAAMDILEGYSLVQNRPFRSPHHSISDAGMIGGNRIPTPGELSLANNGVLFLDEFSEFKKNVLEVMRQPLEDRCVTISRAMGSFTFPANVILIAAMNPCPCGFLGDREKPCECSSNLLEKHHRKVSNPILDRIDMHVEVPRVDFNSLKTKSNGLSSVSLRKNVERAFDVQRQRFSGSCVFNSRMNETMLERFCALNKHDERLLEAAMRKFSLSARAYSKILKVARTIADLEGKEGIESSHLAESIHYRILDRRKGY